MTATTPLLPVPALPDVQGIVFRHPRIPDDLADVAALMSAARRADGLDELVTVGDLEVEWANFSGADPARHFLVAELDGRVVGYVVPRIQPRDEVLALEAWGDVLPALRGRGIDTALLRWARASLEERAAADPRPGPREHRAFAMEVERSWIDLLEVEGYEKIRYGFEMRRSLTGELPDHPLPDGLELRPVEPSQHRTIFEADDEAFRDHWGHHPATEEDFRALHEHPETDTSLWCVAWDGDEVAGVVINAIYREENATLGLARGWLDHVSVRRPWRGRGVAKALCAASFRRLREAGMDEAWLGVDAANPTGALRLYEGLGFHVVRRWFAFARPVEGPAGGEAPR